MNLQLNILVFYARATHKCKSGVRVIIKGVVYFLTRCINVRLSFLKLLPTCDGNGFKYSLLKCY